MADTVSAFGITLPSSGTTTTSTSTSGTTGLKGTKLLDDGNKLSAAIQKGDWISGGMAAFDLVDDALGAASDPIGTLMGAGLGWLFSHMEPLKGWLGALAGNQGEVNQASSTWTSVSGQLTSAGTELQRLLSDVQGQQGATMDAYRELQAHAAQHVQASGEWAKGIAAGMASASKIVGIVHDLVKSALSELVSAAIQWVAEAMASFGLGMPFVIAQVVQKTASLTQKVGGTLKKLLTSIKDLQQVWNTLTSLWNQMKSIIEKVTGTSATVTTPTLQTVDSSKPAEYGTGNTADYQPPKALTPDQVKQLDLLTTGANPVLVSDGDGKYHLADNTSVTSIAGMDTANELAAKSASGQLSAEPGGAGPTTVGTDGSGGADGSGLAAGGASGTGSATIGTGGAGGSGASGSGSGEQADAVLDEWRRNARI